MGIMKIGYRNYIYQIVTSKSVNSLLLGNNQRSFEEGVESFFTR